MRHITTFVLAATFTLLLAAGAMAWGGGMGGGYGCGYGYGGRGASPAYQNYQGNGYGPGYQGRAYGPAYCPGWGYQGNQGRGYMGPDQGQAPYQGQGQEYNRPAPATPRPTAWNDKSFPRGSGQLGSGPTSPGGETWPR